jgi:hypothetical protein
LSIYWTCGIASCNKLKLKEHGTRVDPPKDQPAKKVPGHDRRLASAPNIIEVVKILIPRGLFLISIIQLRWNLGCIKVIFVCH